MRIQIELTEKELRSLIQNRIAELAGEMPINATDIKIEVKSKQNFRAEWEEAQFRAVVDKTT